MEAITIQSSDAIKRAVRRIRFESNLSQDVLAERMQVSQQTLSRWENGITEPTISELLLMLTFIPLDTLISVVINPPGE